MLSLLNDILDLLEDDAGVSVFEALHLAGTIVRAARQSSPSPSGAREKGLELIAACADVQRQVIGDPVRIRTGDPESGGHATSSRFRRESRLRIETVASEGSVTMRCWSGKPASDTRNSINHIPKHFFEQADRRPPARTRARVWV